MNKNSNLLDNLISNVISATDPTYGVITTFIFDGLHHFDNKRNKTITQFYTDLFKGVASEKDIEYMKELIKASSEDGYKLLNAAILDDEIEKSIYYTNFYKYILNNQNIDKNEKLIFGRILKELTSTSLNLMYEIHSSFSNLDEVSLPYYYEKIEQYNYDMNLLISLKLLKDNQKAGFISGGEFKIHITEQFKKCIAFYFN